MPRAIINGAGIEYRESGSGYPLLWCHELGGSLENWRGQVEFFSRFYRVITYNARGYPPSDVPAEIDQYSQEIAVADAHGLLRHLGIDKAYVGGLSMGGATALQMGLTHPEMTRALVVAGVGTGATYPEVFLQQAEAMAAGLDTGGMESMRDYAGGPVRVQLKRKNPSGWEEFRDLIARHSALGMANTIRGVQSRRPPLYAHEEQLKRLDVPTLVIVGDEDEPCLEPSLFLKRVIPRCGLLVLPQSGHTINLEEPELFNRAVLDFFIAVETGKWYRREQGTGGGFMPPKGS